MAAYVSFLCMLYFTIVRDYPPVDSLKVLSNTLQHAFGGGKTLSYSRDVI